MLLKNKKLFRHPSRVRFVREKTSIKENYFATIKRETFEVFSAIVRVKQKSSIKSVKSIFPRFLPLLATLLFNFVIHDLLITIVVFPARCLINAAEFFIPFFSLIVWLPGENCSWGNSRVFTRLWIPENHKMPLRLLTTAANCCSRTENCLWFAMSFAKSWWRWLHFN